MKRILFILVIGLLFLSLLSAQEKANPAADMLQNLQKIEKIEAVPAKASPGFESLKARDMMTMMAFLADDTLEGREVGTRGYDTAAAYAQSLFALWGLKPGGDIPRAASRPFGHEPGKPVRQPERGYLQEFVMKEAMEATPGAVLETVAGPARRSRPFQPQVDFVFDSSLMLDLSAPVVFAGYGISEKAIGYDDLAGIDVRDRIVMILSEAPGRDDPASPFQKKELKDRYFPASPFLRRGGGDMAKLSEIFKRGALAVLVVKNSLLEGGDIHDEIVARRRIRDEKPILPDDRKKLLIPGSRGMPWEGRAMVRVSRDMADAILEASGRTVEELKDRIAAKYKPLSFALPGTRLHLSNQVRYQLLPSANVIGFVEGRDPELKKEAVVVGAHLDHLGRRGDYIYNGAEDNASGACSVLAMARALAANPEKPKRSVVFCLWTGEEEGLLGSRWYVENPLFPMKDTLAYINLDMVARPWDEKGLRRMTRMLNVSADELLKKIQPENFLPLSLAAEAPELLEALQQANRSVGFDILYRETPRRMDRMSGGSDHAAFAMAGRPWAFFITGMSDVYHTPGDSMEKFDGTTM
ncbi:MAG: M20/M25/M40 family metallo-hydrolase, partial [Candidatus Aminicenantes bacterium]|nr:M20/M25/M40 family metallo-hydrolase [Candidatus Aminicenantes bacterium]